VPADAKVGRAHVGAFFRAFEAESYAAKIGWGHGECSAKNSIADSRNLSPLEMAQGER
jgi:hypothetical protein